MLPTGRPAFLLALRPSAVLSLILIRSMSATAARIVMISLPTPVEIGSLEMSNSTSSTPLALNTSNMSIASEALRNMRSSFEAITVSPGCMVLSRSSPPVKCSHFVLHNRNDGQGLLGDPRIGLLQPLPQRGRRLPTQYLPAQRI